MFLARQLRSLFSAKRLIFGDECTKAIVETALEISRTASVTLGPMGRNVVIEMEKGEPRITKDGVTVVKHIDYVEEDRLKDAVCTLIKKSVNSTNRFAGDGTTTSTLLVGELLREGNRALEIGESIRDIKEGLTIGRDLGIEFLKMASQKIENETDFFKVAMIATKGDALLSKLISQAVGTASIIKVEKTHRTESYIEFYSGLKMVAGIPHPEFKNVGDKVELDYPLVLLDTRGIKSVEAILGVLELAKKARKQLFIVSTSISDSVLSTLIYNRRKNIVEAYPLILKEYGTIAKDYFKQLALTTEAVIFDQYGPCPLEQIQFKHLGRAIRVDMDIIETSVLGKKSDVCSNAVIYAGGSTEAVALEIYDKIIDALNSVQTSKKHGVVAGGGVTYWRMADMLEQYNGQHQAGVKVLARALRSPRRKLVQNIDQSYRALGGVGWQGFNFKTGKIQDMLEAGIIDSASVGQSVLVDSVSLARMLLDITTCIVRKSKNIETESKDLEQMHRQQTL